MVLLLSSFPPLPTSVPPRQYGLMAVVVLLAHSPQGRLLGALSDRAQPLLGPVGYAPSPLHRYLAAPRHLAALPGWAMGRAEAGLLDVLVAPGMGTLLPPCPVGDA